MGGNMNSQEIKQRLTVLNYNVNEYWVLAGAAMVLYGIKNDTPDIDLGCSKVMADQLEKQYKPIMLPDGTRRFRIDSDVEIFENWLSGGIQCLEGFPIVTIDGLISMKMALGREKDIPDIDRIQNYLEKQQANCE